MNQNANDLEILKNYIVNKALTSDTNVGEALIPQNLEQEMTQTINRLSPEMTMWMNYGKPISVASKFHDFNRISSMPRAGSAQGEANSTSATNSTYSRYQKQLKVFRRKGQLSEFIIDTSRDYIDSMRQETDNQILSFVWDLITSLLRGNSSANKWDIDGVETLISTYRTTEPRGGVSISSLKTLDDMIDSSNIKLGHLHNRVFLVSTKMLSALTRYETTVRRDIPWGVVDIPGGHRLEMYRNIPIVQTSSMSPVESMAPTVTLSGVGTGGGMSDGTYYVQVAPVTIEGEQLASPEQSIVLSAGGSAQRIKIELNEYHPNALYYRVYVSTTTNLEKLNLVAPALYYDSDGKILFDKVVGIDSFIYVDYSTAAGYGVNRTVPVSMQDDVPLVASNGINPESILLLDLDPIQGFGKIAYANIISGPTYGGLITTQPLAQTDVLKQFMLYSHMALVDSYESTSVWHRGLRRE